MNSLKSKIVTVIGLGESGFSACKLLKRLGAKVHVTDNSINEKIKKRSIKLKKLGIDSVELGRHSLGVIDESSLIIVSPGIKEKNKLIKKALRQNIPVISEIELGYQNCRVPIIAISGTNAKTTTCSLLYDVLKQQKKKPLLCGNIGKPFCDVAKDATAENIIILEVSSFQLDYIDRFKPKISAILNIESDHLDHHASLKKYIEAKARIFKNQDDNDYLLLKKEDYENILSGFDIKAKLRLISTDKQADIYIDKNGDVVREENKNKVKIANISSLNLEGAKSKENILFVFEIIRLLNLNNNRAIESINKFKGLNHRLQTIGIFNGIKYIDDSKATNLAATRFALKAMDGEIVLIAGGRYKDREISEVNLDFLDSVKKIVLFGESKHILAKVFGRIKPVAKTDNIYEAVKIAKDKAVSGDLILFSPMCASFDQFGNYKQRGQAFNEAVKSLNE